MKGTVKENREFRYAYKRGKKIVSSYLVLHYVKNRTPVNKLGINVSKLRKAVDRNHAKRLIRVCWQKYQPGLKNGYNIIFVARSAMENAELQDVEKSMEYCFRKSDLT
ncbi:MAG: ribonuclease P protein component [Clostridia bacterium]|nr:ribonuclease P protein component [Clostridia bacterium]